MGAPPDADQLLPPSRRRAVGQRAHHGQHKPQGDQLVDLSGGLFVRPEPAAKIENSSRELSRRHWPKGGILKCRVLRSPAALATFYLIRQMLCFFNLLIKSLRCVNYIHPANKRPIA